MDRLDERFFAMDFSDGRVEVSTVGGKGASLSRLAAAGFPVPTGFHVGVAAYRRFVERSGLEEVADAELGGVDPDRPEELERAAARVRAAFLAAPFPDEVGDEVLAAYGALRDRAGLVPGEWPAVAVRSSATAEDLPGLSFAGQQESFLDVRGPEALLDAVRRCWASLWNGRAVAYRLARRWSGGDLALAVVVQLLVDADAAGILFTADPSSGRRGVALIDAAFGLGEAVVGGRVSPDVVTVDKVAHRVIERTTADKALRTVRLPGGGTGEEPCPGGLRREPVLPDEEALELASLGARVEALYGAPMDIEWARSAGRFWLLQARPITALPEEEPEPPREWPRPSPKAMLARASIVDFAPEPLSPLFETFGLRIYEREFKLFIDELTRRRGVLEGYSYTATVNGYLYVHMKFPPRYFRAVIGAMLGPVWERMKRTAEFLAAERERYRGVALPWESRPLGPLGASELLAAAEELWTAATRFLQCFQTGPAGAGAYEAILARLWDRWARREGEPPASTLLLGLESEATRAEDSLWELSRAAAADPALSSWLRSEQPDRAIDALREAGSPGRRPAGVGAEAWAAFAEGFRGHVDRHCRALLDLDFSKPAASEEPVSPLLALRAWLDRSGSDPRARREAARSRAEGLRALAESRLRGPKAWLFGKALAWALRGAPLREDGIAWIGLGYPALRRVLGELGARLARAGALERPEDVYWLEEGELREAAAALDAGASPNAYLSAVRSRRALWRSRKRVRPPAMIPKVERIMGIKTAAFMPAEADGGPGRLRGLGASGGLVRGPARVLVGAADFAGMRPGEVLVAEITTPAWTPLFALASAVVTDIGGPLSHGSIVAREYGIPAVLGTGSATRRIRTGDFVVVDGDAGTVEWEEA